MILERDLLQSPQELKRIWLHELAHFVWWRMSNVNRRSWERILFAERTRGELGWSSQWRRDQLTANDRERRTRKWREYCCESFCDTAAWIQTGRPKHPEATLAPRYRKARIHWFAIIEK